MPKPTMDRALGINSVRGSSAVSRIRSSASPTIGVSQLSGDGNPLIMASSSWISLPQDSSSEPSGMSS
jgi:hypothetical protein